MKQRESLFLRRPVLWVSFLCWTVCTAVFRALRMVWVFYEPNLRVIGGAKGLFVLMLAFTAASLALLVCSFMQQEQPDAPKTKKKLFRVCGGVCFVGALLVLAALAVVLKLSGAETSLVMLRFLQNDLPVTLAFLVLAAFALLVLPRLKKRGRVVGAVFSALVLLFGALWLLGVRTPYRFLSAPAVMDTGSDYAVVFATNDKGTGFVSYTYAGERRTVYDQIAGRRVSDSCIHTVHVPYSHLKNNSYEIGSTRVLGDYSYGSDLGAEIAGGPFTLQVNESDEQSYLLLSDWHSHLKDAKAAISHLGAYDAVLLLGDSSAGMDVEAQAARDIVQFAGDLTGGEMPVLFVRGNHDTRGPYAAKLPERLGYDRFYYTADRGPYSFLVLDSGEDKPDDHAEYGGLDDFKVNREAMLDWLQGVTVKNDKLLVLTHAWQVSEPEPELSKAAWDRFSALGARFVLSGHMHINAFYQGKTDEERAFLAAYPGVTTYIDGGFGRNKIYIASRLTLTPEGAHFEAADSTGKIVTDETLEW